MGWRRLGKKEPEIIGCHKFRNLALMIISSHYESKKETNHFRLAIKILLSEQGRTLKAYFQG